MHVSQSLPIFAWLLVATTVSASDKVEVTPDVLRELLAAHSVTPLEPAPPRDEAKVKLGQALFFDPILGGNEDVSCATCHHPATATADPRSRAGGMPPYVAGDGRLPQG
ncbi:MAG: cytochrome-c peroxidase, partial [Verrucomicrobiales bacterium]|nr:cytochrome-c peroxidase [Verrucomicrobiales bacterium]